MKYLANKEYTLQSLHNFSQTTELPEYPLEVFLEISNVCDLKCAMCGTFSALDQWRFFHLKETERGFFDVTKQTSLESVLKHAVLVHCFGYGEPTIHPNFKEIIDYISEFEVLIDFFTNGMHLTEDLCEFLVQKKVFRVYVSFSGSTKEDYENIYIGGNFETVLNGIKLLSKTKKKYQSKYPQIEINSLAFQHHVDKIVDFVSLMAKYGANTINLKPLETHKNIPYLNTHVALMRPWVEGKLLKKAKFRAFLKNIRFDASHFINTQQVKTEEEFILKKEQLLQGTTTIPIKNFKSIAKELTIFKPNKETENGENFLDNLSNRLNFDYPEELEQPCFEPFKTLYVSRNGQTKPCCFGQNAVSLGNISQSSAQEIWQNGGFLLIRENITTGKYPMAICKECIERKSTSQYHAMREILQAYNLWLRRSYKISLPDTILKNIYTLGDNYSIINKLNTDPIILKKIINITLNKEKSSQIIDFYIDYPLLGFYLKNNCLEIHGWILSSLPQPLTIELYHNNELLESTPVNIFRQDVTNKFADTIDASSETGFFISHQFLFEDINTYYLSLNVKLENNQRYLLCNIQLKIFQANSRPKKIESLNNFLNTMILLLWTNSLKKIFKP